MNFLKTIKEGKLIDESLMQIIFGDLLDDEDYWWAPEYDFPRLAYSISLFYFGLIQCYCFAKAQEENKLVQTIALSEKIVNPIANIWNVEMPDRFNSVGELFSFLIFGSEKADAVIFRPETKSKIVMVKKAYEELSSNSRKSLHMLSREDFLSFIESLPLLKNARFFPETMKIEFQEQQHNFSIKISPFISFLSFEANPLGEPVDTVTTNCYILTSVSKGERNNELFFDTLRLDSTDSVMDKKLICRQLRMNENLKFLCKTANIQTQWYPVDECWCDLKFLNKMVNATENVLLKYCGIKNREFQSEEDIKGKLLGVLEDTDADIVSEIREREVINVSELNEVLFELFLKIGLFKTVRCIILNPKELRNASSERMFRYYFEELEKSSTVTSETSQLYKAQCQQKIDAALEKLAHIIPKTLAAYSARKCEIDAEWKAFYVLKAAGIKNERLFADVESILSIDDYYDMLRHNEGTPEYDLLQLLRMLCIFYGALLENTRTFDERKFYRDVEKIAPKFSLSKHTLESLFEHFIEIAEKSESSDHVKELLGRNGLGVKAKDYISFCYKKILEARNNSGIFFDDVHQDECLVFVSYAHEDKEQVKSIVNRWKSQGLNVFFDEKEIHYGQDWQKKAEAAMDSEQCKLVVAFMSEKSVCKKSVKKELVHANVIRELKFPNDPEKRSRFILPINLEDKDIGDYLPKIAEIHPDVDGAREYAKEISEFIKDKTIHINYKKTSEEELDEIIRQSCEEMSENEGRVVIPAQFDEFKLAVANFYAFLKYGKPASKTYKQIDEYFNNEKNGLSKCIYPIVASIKETRIKRDNIAIIGYELIRGKGRAKSKISYILTSKVLDVDDYYCIPKYRNSEKEQNWMIEPLLIKCDKFLEIISRVREWDSE